MIQRFTTDILLAGTFGLGSVSWIAILSVVGPVLAATTERECLLIETQSAITAFQVEIADSPETMSLGLMWRTDLREDRGMLFVYDPPRHASFWMKNTLIPLDMLFIAVDGTVHRIEYNAQPLSLESIPSGIPVRAVLEIAAGVADKVGVQPGDRVHHAALGDSRLLRRGRVLGKCR